MFNRWQKSTFEEMFEVSYGHAVFFHLLWLIYWLFIPVSMIRAILINAYKSSQLSANNEKDIFAYVWRKLYKV